MDVTTDSLPTWLDDGARREMARLLAAGAVAQADRDALAVYCFVRGWWLAAQRVVEALAGGGGGSWVDRDGGLHPHPVYALEAELAHRVNELAAGLGLAPIGRRGSGATRIVYLDEGTDDDAG